MALSLILLFLLLLVLGLVQAWTVWYLRRQVARLDQRLDESLDDQDLLDFQERLQSLLEQSKAAAGDMVRSVQERQAALEKSLALVREAEKQLLARTQVLNKAADAAAERAEKLQSEEADRKFVRAPKKAAPKRPAPRPAAPTRLEEPETAEAPAPDAEKTSPAPATAAPASGPSRHQRIYDLADRGLSRDQIAKEAGVLPGEVELILNLRPRRR